MDVNKITMISTRLLVKTIDESANSSGKLLIADVAKDKPTTGKVLTSGPGLLTPVGELIPNTVKAGDVIMFSKGTGNTIKINNEDYLVIEEKDVMLIIGD